MHGAEQHTRDSPAQTCQLAIFQCDRIGFELTSLMVAMAHICPTSALIPRIRTRTFVPVVTSIMPVSVFSRNAGGVAFASYLILGGMDCTHEHRRHAQQGMISYLSGYECLQGPNVHKEAIAHNLCHGPIKL